MLKQVYKFSFYTFSRYNIEKLIRRLQPGNYEDGWAKKCCASKIMFKQIIPVLFRCFLKALE